MATALPRSGVTDPVAVLIAGPIIGPFLLTHDESGIPRASATVLIEVDAVCKVECICEDVLSGEIYARDLIAAARRARVLRVPGLRLGRRYSLGICINSAKERMQTCFHTPDNAGADINMCILSGYKPTEHLPDEPDILSDVAKRLGTPWNGLDVVIHIGFRASFVAAVQETALVLYRNNNSRQIGQNSSQNSKTRRALEHHVLERFRDEYRATCSTPSMRAILASSTNIFTGCARTLLASASALPACDRRRFEATEAIVPDTEVEDADKEWRVAVLQAIHLALRVSFEWLPRL